MTDINEIKAGEYELVAELFDQPTSKPTDPVFTFDRKVKGDRVTLTEAEAKRLYAAGAVVIPGEREQVTLDTAKMAYEAALAAYKAAGGTLPDADGDGEADRLPDPLEDMDAEALTAYAGQHGIDLGRATSGDGIRAKIREQG